MMSPNRVPLSSIVERLGVKDARTAEQWCKSHGVKIECVNKRKFIWDAQFELVFRKIFLKRLEEDYPFTYKEIYMLINSDDFLNAYELSKEPINPIPGSYKPVGGSSKKFLNDIGNE